MSVLSIPNLFTTGTTIQAAPFNQNFTAVQTAVNNVDNTNIGAAGLFASNLIPTTSGNATFGGLVGYIHAAPSAGITPLTIAGFAAQSVDILDVTLTSGGTKTFFIDKNGALNFGNATLANLPSANAAIVGTAGSGTNMALNVATGGVYQFWVNGSTGTLVSQMSATVFAMNGEIFASAVSASSPSAPGSIASGDIVAQRTASTGIVWCGGASANYGFDGGAVSAGNISLLKNGSSIGTFNGTTGVYTASDERYKDNIAPLPSATKIVASLRPVSFNWKENGELDAGFIAQEVQPLIPQAVIVMEDKSGKLGMNYSAVVPYLAKELQDLRADFAAYVAAHP